MLIAMILCGFMIASMVIVGLSHLKDKYKED